MDESTVIRQGFPAVESRIGPGLKNSRLQRKELQNPEAPRAIPVRQAPVLRVGGPPVDQDSVVEFPGS